MPRFLACASGWILMPISETEDTEEDTQGRCVQVEFWVGSWVHDSGALKTPQISRLCWVHLLCALVFHSAPTIAKIPSFWYSQQLAQLAQIETECGKPSVIISLMKEFKCLEKFINPGFKNERLCWNSVICLCSLKSRCNLSNHGFHKQVNSFLILLGFSCKSANDLFVF